MEMNDQFFIGSGNDILFPWWHAHHEAQQQGAAVENTHTEENCYCFVCLDVHVLFAWGDRWLMIS